MTQASRMTQAKGQRRGQGGDSSFWDSSNDRYVGAVSLGFSSAGTRIRRKVTGRTKAEIRDRTGLPASDRACPYSRRRGEGPGLRLTRRLPGGR